MVSTAVSLSLGEAIVATANGDVVAAKDMVTWEHGRGEGERGEIVLGIQICNYLDLFKVIFYGLYHGKSQPPFGRICLELFPSILSKTKIIVRDGPLRSQL